MLMRRATSLAALVGAELSAVVLLIRLGPYVSSPPGWHGAGRWLAETPPEDAIVAVVHLLAMGIAWWLTATTILYAVARATRVPALVRGVSWVTLPPLRRMIDGVLATTIIASSTFGGGRMAVAEPAESTGRAAEGLNAKEVAGCWVQLVETNRHTIRSGNPNLIYPGETIALPSTAQTVSCS